MDRRYLQLYSIKEETAKDFAGALRKVKEIGYTGVEFAGGMYGGYSAADLKELLADLNLDPISSHIVTDLVPDHIPFAAELGIKYLIDPMASINNYDEAMTAAEKFNKAGKLCADAGIAFGYHNHRHEFLTAQDGYLLETIMINTDPKLVCIELDVGWAACAGADYMQLLKKYAGRFKLIHVKECNHAAGAEPMPDFSKFPRDETGALKIPPEILKKLMAQRKWNAPLGTGIIDWNAVRDTATTQGVEAFVVEREYDYAGDIFKCVEEDCVFLKSL